VRQEDRVGHLLYGRLPFARDIVDDV
jgi:hypothetical protein